MIYLVTNQTSFQSEEFPLARPREVLAYFDDKREVQLDTESNGLDPYSADLLITQFGDRENQFVVDTTTVPVKEFKPLLESDKLFLLQNAKHDLRFFLHHDISIKYIYDTMLAEAILTTGHRNRDLDLKSLGKKYCDVDFKKEVRGAIANEGLSIRVINYAAMDVRHLQDIKDKQMKQLVKYDLANPSDTQDKYTVLGLENRVCRVFAHMEYIGVKIDQPEWKKTTLDLKKEVEKQRKILDKIVIEEDKLDDFVPRHVQSNLFGYDERHLEINYKSPKQKVAILNALGLNTKTSEDRFLQKNQDHHEFIPELRHFNTVSKLASSFGDKILNKVNTHTGRLHPDIWQILQTGRISVSEPNVNQIPRKGDFGPRIRQNFIPKKGYKMVGGDYAQFELRIIAQFSKDPLWLKIFNDDLDLHTTLCKQTFDIPESEVREDYPINPDITYRDIQKTINYGLAYGMTEHKLSDTMKTSPKEALKVINAFFSKIPKVKALLDHFENFGKKKGYITTPPPYLRRRWFPSWERARRQRDDYLLGSIGRRAKNTPIQGANGDIIKLALINIYEDIEKNHLPVNIVMSIYDEVQTECHKDFAQEWRGRLENHLIQAGKVTITDVPIVADCTVDDFWNH